MAKVLCMEIGTSTVRLAEVEKTGKSVKITKTFVFDTPDDASKDGKIRVSDSVVSAIKDGIYESGIKASDVYFVVESTKILYKQIETPFVPKKNIESMLLASFSDYFPVDETLYHVSYVFEGSYEKNGQKWMALDVFAIPNDLSESYYNLSVALGLNAKGLTDTSRSMISLFPSSFKNRNVAMVNINENSSTLTISVNGDMVFNKTIPYGVYNTIRHVMNSPLTMADIDITGAVELLYTQNILLRQIPEELFNPDDEQEQLRFNATTSIVSLIKNIESTFAAFLSKEKIHIQEFHLSGLGAGFAGISQLMAHEFGIPVTVVQQEGNLRVAATAADDTLLLSCYPCVGAVIDAANFFTASEKAGGEIASKRRVDHMFLFIGIIVFLASAGYGAYSWLEAQIAHQDAYEANVQLKKKVQELRDLGVEIAYNNYVTAQSYNEEVLKLYDETRSGNEEMTLFLEELENILPKSAKTTSITLTPSTASITFVCEDRFVAAGVLHLLRNMNTINNMECPGVSELENSEQVAFNCQFALKTTAQMQADAELEGEQGAETGDEIVTEPIEDEEEKLFAELASENVTGDIAMITIGSEQIDTNSLSDDVLNFKGFSNTSKVFMAYNDAISMTGVTYQTDSGIELSVAEDESGMFGVKSSDPNVLFSGGIHAGMTIAEAQAAAPVFVESENGFIILKSSENTLILEEDWNGEIIETVYLVNNRIFISPAPEQETQPTVSETAPPESSEITQEPQLQETTAETTEASAETTEASTEALETTAEEGGQQ